MKNSRELELNFTKSYLQQFPWEWFCSLSCYKNSSSSDIEKYLHKWCLFRIKDRIRIAYIGVINYIPFPHIHLLMLGTSKTGSLLNRNPDLWKKQWGKIMKKSAVIEPIYSDGAIGYLVDQNMPYRKFDYVTFNERLLIKKQRAI